MGGRPVPNEDLVNLPNPLVLKLRVEGEEPFSLANVELLAYGHEYDIRNAVVLRRLRFRDRAGRETSLISRRFVSMNRMHQAALAWDVVPENWSGRLEIVTAIDGRVTNQGVARYRQLEGRHLDPQAPRILDVDTIALKARTRQSRIEIAAAARTRAFRAGKEIPVTRETYQTEDYIQQVLAFDVWQGRAGARREDGRDLHVARPRDHRAAAQRRRAASAATRPSKRRFGATRAPGRSCGTSATSSCRASRACSSCCGCTSHTCCRRARA